MLNPNALSQLTKLKTDIQSSKEYGQGAVAGTNGRFGFVRLEDGRDAFLSPEKMARLIPGDVIKVSLTKNKKEQLEAHIEELVDSPLKRFVGQYKVKGTGHFVVPVGTQAPKWIFVPPKVRKKCKDGDFVTAIITQHPFADGKAQAKVLDRIGQEDEAFIERKYVAAKHDLSYRPQPTENDEINKIVLALNDSTNESLKNREDLTHLPFVTIDAETTSDMDDALTIEAINEGEEGFRLYVAIADPASFISPQSSIGKRAQISANSVYLVGGALPMLPEKLGNDCFSLVPEQVRPALVCVIELSPAFEPLKFDFIRANIKSHFKLSYNQVGAFLANDNEPSAIAENIQPLLKTLSKFAHVRNQYRHKNCWVGDEQLEYDYELSDKGKIASISPRPKNLAHQLVEETMLLTNHFAGQYLQDHQCGLHTVHEGFRPERLGEVNALLKEEDISPSSDITSLDGYLSLLTQLGENESKKSLLAPLKRLMQASQITHTPGAHLGLGMHSYATITSPIRRFVDVYNHWSILQTLGGKKVNALPAHILEKLNERIQLARQADRELHQWLLCQYAQSLVGQEHKGNIRIVTQQGFGVRIQKNGVDGFVLFPKKTSKKFDAKRMTISVGDQTYSLDMEVTIKVTGVDLDKRRISYEIIDPVHQPEKKEETKKEETGEAS